MRKILASMLLLLATQLAFGNHFNCANVCVEKGKDVSDHRSGSNVGISSLLRMLLSHVIGFCFRSLQRSSMARQSALVVSVQFSPMTTTGSRFLSKSTLPDFPCVTGGFLVELLRTDTDFGTFSRGKIFKGPPIWTVSRHLIHYKAI